MQTEGPGTVAVNTLGSRAPRILFAPVSGPHGSGELMRCLIIARELRRADPGIDVCFLVSRDAVFRDAVNFPIIDCDASPTRSTSQVLAAIESFRPHVMVFDNSGRTEQLRAAKRAGAKLVFTSRAPRLRWKAFRLKWMRLLDEHWLVFPAFVTGALTPLERLKLKFFPGYRVRHFDTFFTPTEAGARQEWLAGRGLEPGQFTVFIPGGRGEQHKAADPAGLFVDAAREFVAATGRVAVVLTGSTEPLASAAADSSGLRLFPRISPAEVQHLLAAAELVVSNGGTSMIHALAHGHPLVAVPLASDQLRRIRRAEQAGVAVRGPLDAVQIAAAAASLLGDRPRRDQMQRRIAELGVANGIGEAVAALRALARSDIVPPGRA
jgi:spore coat polysaccharide biosynthesis predicted glycosyltransferase SpsG